MANTALLCEGQQDHLIPSTSQILVDSDLFGSWKYDRTFLNNGPKLHWLGEAIVHVLLHGDIDTVTVHLDDVADLDIQRTIHMVNTKLLKALVNICSSD